MQSSHDEKLPELLAIGEAARRLGVSVETVRRWAVEGKLTPVRTVGNHRRFQTADVDALSGRAS